MERDRAGRGGVEVEAEAGLQGRGGYRVYQTGGGGGGGRHNHTNEGKGTVI